MNLAAKYSDFLIGPRFNICLFFSYNIKFTRSQVTYVPFPFHGSFLITMTKIAFSGSANNDFNEVRRIYRKRGKSFDAIDFPALKNEFTRKIAWLLFRVSKYQFFLFSPLTSWKYFPVGSTVTFNEYSKKRGAVMFRTKGKISQKNCRPY